MQSSNLLRAVGAIAALVALSAQAQVLTPAQPMPGPAGLMPLPAPKPEQPNPTAPVAASSAAFAGGTLKQIEALQREKSLAELRKQIAELGTRKDQAPETIKPTEPLNLPAGGVPALAPAAGSVAAIPPMLAEEVKGPEYRVLSIVSFRGETVADVILGEVVSTVRVGDTLDDAKVVSIDLKGGVVVEREVTRITRAPAIGKAGKAATAVKSKSTERVKLERAFSGFTPIAKPLDVNQPPALVPPPSIPRIADATTVPPISR